MANSVQIKLNMSIVMAACSFIIIASLYKAPTLATATRRFDNYSGAVRRPPPLMIKSGPSNFTFYMHNTVYDPAINNPTFDSVYSAGPLNMSQPNPYSFGVHTTFEDKITEGPSPDSTQIGVAQGVWFFTSKTEFTLFHIFTATINDGPYTGTVSIMGQLREALPERILTVTGGTGDFLGARGVAINKLVTIDRSPPATWTLSFDLNLYY